MSICVLLTSIEGIIVLDRGVNSYIKQVVPLIMIYYLLNICESSHRAVAHKTARVHTLYLNYGKQVCKSVIIFRGRRPDRNG